MEGVRKPIEFAANIEGAAPHECVVRVAGVLDFHTKPKFETVIAPLLAPSGPQRLVLDLSAVSFMDSAGLAALVRARRALWDRGGRVALLGCQPHVRYALEITRLVKLFDMPAEGPAA